MREPATCRRCGVVFDAHGFVGSRRGYCSFSCRIDKGSRKSEPLTAEALRSIVDYNPATGTFVWKERQLRVGLERTDRGWNTRLANKPVAFRIHRHGHLYIGIEYRNYAAHRLAWLHVHGCWPESDLDHANGNPADNRIANLRPATASENLRNARRRSDNTSGHKGVSWNKKSRKWYAYINVDGRMLPLGLHATREAAIAARRQAAKRHFGEYANEH